MHPEQAANTVERGAFERIWRHSVELLRRGFQSGSILTVDPEEAKRLGKPWTRRRALPVQPPGLGTSMHVLRRTRGCGAQHGRRLSAAPFQAAASSQLDMHIVHKFPPRQSNQAPPGAADAPENAVEAHRGAVAGASLHGTRPARAPRTTHAARSPGPAL